MLAAALVVASASAGAAQVSSEDFADLVAAADRIGKARVVVTLAHVSLHSMRNEQAKTQAQLEVLARTLLSELGTNASKAASWQDNVGHIGVLVNRAGLETLLKTSSAIEFGPDKHAAYHTRANNRDQSLDAVERLIAEKGHADVELWFNVAADHDIDRFGQTSFKSTPSLLAEVDHRFAQLKASEHAPLLTFLDEATSRSAEVQPFKRARIGHEAFHWLRESEHVRAIRPLGWKDPREARFDPAALSTAQQVGSADLILSLRGGSNFSPKSGYMSSAAWKAQEQAHARAMDSILRDAGADPKKAITAPYFGTGSAQLRLSAAEVSRLYEGRDPRILAVDVNAPMGRSTLTNSTVLLNMASAWNAGYHAAGQNIVILDSGIRKDHAMFRTNGASRVIYEACFGTNDFNPFLAKNFQSICPNPNSEGDSPLNTSGSGAPNSNTALCDSLARLKQHDCGHGTHVAGIAAGRASASVTPSTLQGVAIGANLISVQMFSYDSMSQAALVYPADTLGALGAVLAATTATGDNPYVVNMSYGGDTFDRDCGSRAEAITTAIENLTSRRVPVIAGTGNDRNKNVITFPSCVPYTIKVSAVANDSSGTTVPAYANLGDPSRFTGPILLAPGGDELAGPTVISAGIASSTAVKGMYGTSMAAPHAAGVYAAIKAANPGISVATATRWIETQASFSVSYTMPGNRGVRYYRRIKIPQL